VNHEQWYNRLGATVDREKECMAAIETTVDVKFEADEGKDDLEWETLVREEPLAQYPPAMLAKMLKKIVKLKRRPRWSIAADDDDEIGQIGYTS